MYSHAWDPETGGIILHHAPDSKSRSEDVAPVFCEELDWLGFDSYWDYPNCSQPLMWKTNGGKYYYQGSLVAERSSAGGLFLTPTVRVFSDGLTIDPVDIASTVSRNRSILDGLAITAIEEIVRQDAVLSKNVDVQAVAFSGGKDSMVLLDLVQRALDPDEFLVVFSDTHMEVSETLHTLDAAKAHWPALSFHVARSSRPALETWRDMGPPSRMHRWCCTVHKSAPSLILLRELTGIDDARVLMYDGVRSSESQSRGSYRMVSAGKKHSLQVNMSPILDWNSAEIYLYTFARQLPMNPAYRYGAIRCGCVVCPLSSRLWDSLITERFYDRACGFIDLLKDYAYGIGIPESEVRTYLSQGGWKGRSGGRGVNAVSTRLTETRTSNRTVFSASSPREDWKEWFKSLGQLHQESSSSFLVDMPRHGSFAVCYTEDSANLRLELDGFDSLPREAKPLVRAAINKSIYCAHCRGCEVECPVSALSTYPTVSIDQDTCIHCDRCLQVSEKGCLSAKSLWITLGGARVKSKRKSLNPYNHFGMRQEWLEEFLVDPADWPQRHTLGPRQFDSMKVWLKQSGIVTQGSLSHLGSIIYQMGLDSEIAWCAIWANLAQNSGIVEWYVQSVPWGSVHDKADYVDMLGDSWSPSTRYNGVTALVGLLRDTPLGNKLGLGMIVTERGNRVKSITKKGIRNPDPIAVLYSLYLYAETNDIYSFTVTQLEDMNGGPIRLFGCDRRALASMLNGLSASLPDFISVNIVRNLDNIQLRRERTSLEVLQLAID
jgi:phosphoadenosine phosphosulfate reductase